MNKLNFFRNRKKNRCIHRHTIESHPNCFNKDGTPKTSRDGRTNPPKILIFDIETSPLKAYVWQKSVWKASVTEDQVLSEWFMLCWSAKWLFDAEIMSDRLRGHEAKAEDDGRIVKTLWNLMNEADIVVVHNGGSFDVPNMNTRFIVNGLPPTAPYQTIDTVQIARKQFGFTHNNLNALARVFGFKAKLETNFELWKRCVAGEDSALQNMETYNRRDVELLEEVYIKIRPWIFSHPNLGLYIDAEEPVCSNCGSNKLEKTNRFYYTPAGKYALYRCECGAYIRVRSTSLPKEKRKNLLVPISK